MMVDVKEYEGYEVVFFRLKEEEEKILENFKYHLQKIYYMNNNESLSSSSSKNLSKEGEEETRPSASPSLSKRAKTDVNNEPLLDNLPYLKNPIGLLVRIFFYCRLEFTM